MTRTAIIENIKRLAAENGGKAPGRARLERETGIRYTDWYPKLWLRWGDALAEAGFEPGKLVRRMDDDILLEKYVSLVRELGRAPLRGELEVQAQRDPAYPSEKVFRRFGGKSGLISAARDYCERRTDFSDVVGLLPMIDEPKRTHAPSLPKVAVGVVYLMKSGRHFKIGRSNSIGRREYELGIKIPIPPRTLHAIETDDPEGVEAYWHRRFASKRGEGEWFTLTADDVAAFKRWRRIA